MRELLAHENWGQHFLEVPYHRNNGMGVVDDGRQPNHTGVRLREVSVRVLPVQAGRCRLGGVQKVVAVIHARKRSDRKQ